MMSSAQPGSEKTNYADVVKAGLPQVSQISFLTTSPPSSLTPNIFASTNTNIPVTTVPLSALTAESIPSTAMIMSSAPSKFFNNDSTYFTVNVNNIYNIVNTTNNNNNIINPNTTFANKYNNNNNNGGNNNEQKVSSDKSNNDKVDEAKDSNKSSNIKNTLGLSDKKLQHEEEKEQEQEQQQHEGKQEQICEIELTSDTHKRNVATLPAMAANAKPYIPSYLAAAKRAVGVVKLDGVPVRVNEQAKTTDAWCSSTVSTSLMDPESNSSWADDDESFLQTVARQQDAMRVKMVNECKSSTTISNSSNANGNDRQPTRRDNTNNTTISNNDNRFVFEFIKDDEEEFSSNTTSRRNRERFSQVHNRVGRRNNWRNKNHNNQPQQQTQYRNRGTNAGSSKQQDSANIISGGRFDVLANPRVMRHL